MSTVDERSKSASVRVDPQLRRNYDEYYSGSSAWRELGAIDKATNIVLMCGGLTPKKLLDIGAGEGALLQRLAALGFGEEYSALEISASGVESIGNRRIAPLVDCQQFDGYNIPYVDGAFDLAILCHVLEHVEHPRLVLSEAARVARFVFVEVPLEHTRALASDFVWNNVGHINFYTAKTIRLLVQSCGYRVLDQRQTHPSLEQYRFRLGSKGVGAYLCKELALRLMPATAQRRWTYHSSLLLRSGHGRGL
jgi:SAM-dependent methyltransferase